jgi:hypothetical protein
MIMKIRIVLYFGLTTIVLLFACRKEPKEKILCYNQTECHFSGIVNGIVKCFNEGINNYQGYSGTNLSGDLKFGSILIGMNTYPVRVGDENIYLVTPIIEVKNLDQIDSIFPVRKLTQEEISNFKIYYELITETNNNFPVRYSTLTGKLNKDSSIEIVSFEATNTNSYTLVKIKLRISCKLYDSSNMQTGEIKSGELAGKIYLLFDPLK